MPFNPKKPPKDLKKKIKKRHPDAGAKEIRQWIYVFNAAIENGESEARAFAKAWGVLNQNDKLKDSHRKTNKKETIKEIKRLEKKKKRKKKSSMNSLLLNLKIALKKLNETDTANAVAKLEEMEF